MKTFTAKAQTIEVDSPDRFWGFDINPTNPFQLATSTSEALILYDLRYLQRPTLDWRHAAKTLPRPHVKFMPYHALLDRGNIVVDSLDLQSVLLVGEAFKVL